MVMKGLCTERQARYLEALTKGMSDADFDRFVGMHYTAGNAWRRQRTRRRKLRMVSRIAASMMIRDALGRGGVRRELEARGYRDKDGSASAVVAAWMRGNHVSDPSMVPDWVVRQAMAVHRDGRLRRLALSDVPDA